MLKLYKWKEEPKVCLWFNERVVEGLICSVREEPNSVQPYQFRFLTNHCQARAANARKQPEKLGWESGVFSGVMRNAFRDLRNSPEKSLEKSSGPRSFQVFWETHASSLFTIQKYVLKILQLNLLSTITKSSFYSSHPPLIDLVRLLRQLYLPWQLKEKKLAKVLD